MSLPKSIIWLLITVLLWLVVFFESIQSAYGIWMDSATYNHCLFVIPIALYLIWQKMPLLLKAPIKPSYTSLFIIIGLMLLWALGFAGKINVFQHAAVFSILPLILVSSIGLKAARIIWFPLLFMLFSVPIGEELIPLFQQITADLSVQMLLWSGIPVFREGLFIQVPGGKFLVAEACSGIRFFVSTVMLGALCAYIFFTSTKKRIAFILFSFGLPIIANAIRAYGIMLVGYLSGMEHAVGADHLIYGWVFFAIVTGLLILVGNFFKDDLVAHVETQDVSFSGDWVSYPFKAYKICFIAVFLVFFAWKMKVAASSENVVPVDTSSFSQIFDIPELKSNMASPYEWKPIFSTADVSFQANAKYPDHDIGFHYFAYTGENGGELISWKNRVYDPEKWTLEKSKNIEIVLEDKLIHAQVLELYSNIGKSRKVLYWYQVPGLISSDKLKIKTMQAINVLLGVGRVGVFMSVSIDGAAKETRLTEWLKANYLQLSQAYIARENMQSTQQRPVAN